MDFLPERSPDRIVRQLRAERLKRIFWQGENPIGGPREDVCPIVAEYYEIETINNLKGTNLCYSTRATRSLITLLVCAELLKVAVITLSLFLYCSSPKK